MCVCVCTLTPVHKERGARGIEGETVFVDCCKLYDDLFTRQCPKIQDLLKTVL